MNRRTLLTSVAIALTMPLTDLAEAASPRCGTAVRTFQLSRSAEAGHGTLSVTVRHQGGLVAPLPTDDEIMDPVIDTGHERVGIEFYIVAQDTLPPPEELGLESIFVTWTSLEGATARRRDGGIAVLQDGGTRWTIATSNVGGSDRTNLLETVAMAVSHRRASAGPNLLELLPGEDELPSGWTLATERVSPEPCER